MQSQNQNRMASPLIQHLNLLATERWARQGFRRVLRATWLAACLWCIALGGHLLWNWPLRYDWMGIATLLIIGMSVALLLRRRMQPVEVARRLDRRFQLNEQLATAVEVTAANPATSGVPVRLLRQADATVNNIHHYLNQKQPLPWSDMLSLLALLIAILGLYLLIATSNPLNPSPATPLPPLVPPATQEDLADEPFQQSEQSGTESEEGGMTPGDARSLGALADALREQGATRPAAEALDRGDVPGAASSLRELADQAGQLSQDSRNDLADRLRDAASQIAPNDSALADQLRQSASGLESGGQDAQQALDDLAQAIEQLQNGQQSGQGQSEQNGLGESGDANSAEGQNQTEAGDQNGMGGGAGNSSSGEQRQNTSNDRLGVEGKPLELEAQGDGQTTQSQQQGNTGTSSSASGSTSGGNPSSSSQQVGADPLRVPLEDRDVVQDYFSK